jgi:hypothetical protein
MTRSRSAVKYILIIPVLLVLAAVVWFFATRFWVDQYAITPDWETIAFKGATYVPQTETYASEAELQQALEYMNAHVGRYIGVAVFPERSLTDLIWPVWVMEYDGDKQNQKIFVRGLMDVGSVYVIRQP